MRIVPEPGKTIEKGTIVVRDGVIEAAGADVKPPADARVIDLSGKTAYAGLIDALVVDEDDDVNGLEVQAIVTRTLMTDAASRRRVAASALSVPV